MNKHEREYAAGCIYNLESLLSEYGIAYRRVNRTNLVAGGLKLRHNGDVFLVDGTEAEDIFVVLANVAEHAA